MSLTILIKNIKGEKMGNNLLIQTLARTITQDLEFSIKILKMLIQSEDPNTDKKRAFVSSLGVVTGELEDSLEEIKSSVDEYLTK